MHTLDLHFQGVPGTIASYLFVHDGGAVLVESGPGSTTDALTAGLAEHDLAPEDVTDLLLTHIHLDHAGAAGWLAERGAHVHVHHVGAPHLIDPSKLLKSAGRIYGDEMDRLWGEMLPVPEDQLTALRDGDVIEVGALRFEALDTPGHAYHHLAYLHAGGTCYTGDVAGVRLPGEEHVVLPLPPPEIDLPRWRSSLATLRTRYDAGEIERLAPTHFGLKDDVERHLDLTRQAVEAADAWVREVMPEDPSDEELRERVGAWLRERAEAQDVPADTWKRYETANPSWMAAAGLRRYWQKHVAGD